jgi:hypothetical protein
MDQRRHVPLHALNVLNDPKMMTVGGLLPCDGAATQNGVRQPESVLVRDASHPRHNNAANYKRCD